MMRENKIPRITNWSQISIGVLAIFIGILLYVFDRPPKEVYFVPDSNSLYQGEGAVFGVIGNYLPTFLHVLAFCLVTAGVLGSKRLEALWVCIVWALIDTLLELGQHPDISAIIARAIPDWFSSIPLLDNIASYFINGHYDTIDIASILVGASCAFGIICLTTSVEFQYNHSSENGK
jgi:hypothetical protein